MEYTIHKQTTKEAEVIFIDPMTNITYSRSVPIGDCDTQEKLDQRIGDHLRAFSHRINIGVITGASLPYSDTFGDIVISPSLSKESRLLLTTVIETKTKELKLAVEKQLTKLTAEGKDTTEVQKRIADIDAVNKTAANNKINIAKE